MSNKDKNWARTLNLNDLEMQILESNKTFFQLTGVLGEGLNSCVYTAIRTDAQKTFKQKVALKILKSEKDVEAWRHEVDSLAKVDSLHCVRVLDFEWLNGKPALVLEWVDGLTLEQLHQRSTLSDDSLKEIALQIQQGLVDLHQSGLCHGDLNPNNVLISSKGGVKLVDFGLANTLRHSKQGTPAFMAPEVLLGNPPNFWSDLYSLGTLLKYLGLQNGDELKTLMESRDLLPGKSNSFDRTTLGALVSSVQKKMLQTEGTETQIIGRPRPNSYRYKICRSLVFTILSVFLVQADGQRPLGKPCEVVIRTQKWIEVSLSDGQRFTTPANGRINNCSPITLKWKSLNRSGSLHLQFMPGERRLITDADLSL